MNKEPAIGIGQENEQYGKSGKESGKESEQKYVDKKIKSQRKSSIK